MITLSFIAVPVSLPATAALMVMVYLLFGHGSFRKRFRRYSCSMLCRLLTATALFPFRIAESGENCRSRREKHWIYRTSADADGGSGTGAGSSPQEPFGYDEYDKPVYIPGKPNADTAEEVRSDAEAWMWCVTLPYDDIHPEFDIYPSEFMQFPMKRRLLFILQSLRERPGIAGAEASVCKAKKDFPHIHVVVRFRYSAPFSTVKNLFGLSAHIEPVEMAKTKGKIAYIYKIGRWGYKGESIIAAGSFGKVVTRQGQRTDLEAIDDDLDLPLEVILHRHPSENPQRLAYIRRRKQERRQVQIGTSRTVRVHFVTGAERTGKTIATEMDADAAEIPYASYTGENSMEYYGGEPVMIMENPTPDACSKDDLIRFIGSKVSRIKVRFTHSLTQWDHLYITTPLSAEKFAAMYGIPEAMLLRYISSYRYMFRVVSDVAKDGYLKTRYDGQDKWLRYDSITVPVSEYAYKGHEDLRRLTRIYADLTVEAGEIAEGLKDVTLSVEDGEIRESIRQIIRITGQVVTPESFIYLYNDARRQK